MVVTIRVDVVELSGKLINSSHFETESPTFTGLNLDSWMESGQINIPGSSIPIKVRLIRIL